jgi:flagellar hook-associated protein 3 FlgL
MVFDSGVRTINAQTGKLLQLQQQLATGRRIVNPSDDPVAAARALELTQASDVVTQYSRNRDNAENALALQETQLTGVGELITRVRELAVQGGNGTLTRDNRKAITAELRARYEELIGYANARDGNGKYMFSGYMGDTRPFAGTIEGGAEYFGDDGQRLLQVSPSRIIEISDSGKDIFQRIKNGNGTFVTGVGTRLDDDDNLIQNAGTAVIDGGAVVDPTKWAHEENSNRSYSIQFWVDEENVMNSEPPRQTYYDIIDITDPDFPTSVFTGGPAAEDADEFFNDHQIDDPDSFDYARKYSSGQSIPLYGSDGFDLIDLGANVIVTGDPKSGDSFTLQPSTTQDLFGTLATLITDLEDVTANEGQHALLANRIGFALTNLDQAEQNVLRVRAQIGSRLQEVESLKNINEDVNLQYQQAISNLQDLDYAKTISDLTRKQTDLQAAQQSFVQVSRLSLFNYL